MGDNMKKPSFINKRKALYLLMFIFIIYFFILLISVSISFILSDGYYKNYLNILLNQRGYIKSSNVFIKAIFFSVFLTIIIIFIGTIVGYSTTIITIVINQKSIYQVKMSLKSHIIARILKKHSLDITPFVYESIDNIIITSSKDNSIDGN